MIVFALSVVFVFLVLAALYESWSLPLAVILVVPMCVLCSIAGVWYAGMDINVFTQIGFIVLVGLACKNAILIVEFAKLRRVEGPSGQIGDCLVDFNGVHLLRSPLEIMASLGRQRFCLGSRI